MYVKIKKHRRRLAQEIHTSTHTQNTCVNPGECDVTEAKGIKCFKNEGAEIQKQRPNCQEQKLQEVTKR